MRKTAMIVLAAGLLAAGGASAQGYKAPRNAFGQPDLEGAWSNASLTPLARPANIGSRLTLTPQEVAQLEGTAASRREEGDKPTDPNAPTTGGVGPAGTNYNQAWFDFGSQVMRVAGQPRSSILTTPDGQIPVTRSGQRPRGFGGGEGGAAQGVRGGPMDGPENRSLGERCIISFGRNGGPPMLANGFYNNNYQIVQTRDSVAILIEMVHDVRQVRLNSKHRTDDVRPYFGDSIGWYEGDTLVIETTHIPESQHFFGAWRDLKVTGRIRRVAKDRLLYLFTVEASRMWD